MIGLDKFPDLTKNAMVAWRDAVPEAPEVRSQVAIIEDVTEETSEHSSMSTLPTSRRRNDGDDAKKGELKQGYTIKYKQAEIALEVNVTKLMRKFDKYKLIMKKMREIKRSTVRRMENDIAAMLSYAWSTSYVNIDEETVNTATPDGLPLISESHIPNNLGSAWSNQLGTTNTAISTTVLQDLLQLFNNFQDDGDGRSITVMADSIITGTHVPTSLEVSRILKSTLEAGTDENDINVFKNKYDHIEVPYMDFNLTTETRDSTKAKYCFVANLKNQDRNGFAMETSQAAELEAPEQVFSNSVWQYMSTAIYDYGTKNANFIAGTKGDGTSV